MTENLNKNNKKTKETTTNIQSLPILVSQLVSQLIKKAKSLTGKAKWLSDKVVNTLPGEELGEISKNLKEVNNKIKYLSVKL